jgi:MFS family permease
LKQRYTQGWIAVAVAALAMVGTLPGRTQGLGLITRPLLDDLGLGEVRFAGINLVATLAGAAFALPAGWLIDRAGVRVALTLFQLGLGVVVVGMSRVHGFLALAILLVLTRGLGQTALSIASLATVGKWFSRRISKAMGIYSLALGCGFIAAFPGVQKATELKGWRPTWNAVGMSLMICAALAAVLLRKKPDPHSDELRAQEVTATDGRAFTLGQALAGPAFWIYGLTSALYLLVASGTGLFTELMLRERGLGSDTFRAALATTALVGILANFVGGFLGQRRSLPKLLAISTLLLAPCLAAYPLVRTPLHAIVWAGGMGAAGGIVTVVFFAIWGKLYGALHLGKIQGVAQALTVIGSAVGPVIFAASNDHLGSYTPAFLGLTPIVLLAGAACWFVKPPVTA